MKNLLRKAGAILSWALLAFGVVLLVTVLITRVAGRTPALFGYRFYVVGSGSMRPELEVGDFIIGKEYRAGDAIAVGDVVTYRCTSGALAGNTITHKVISVEKDEGCVITQGVNNPMPDDPVQTGDILSVMVARVRLLGWYLRTIEKPIGFIGLFVIPVLMVIGFEIFDFIKSSEKGRETEENANETNENEKG